MLSLFWGFILTMWYVKKLTRDNVGEVANSFILTMWYVKILDEAISVRPYKCVLY